MITHDYIYIAVYTVSLFKTLNCIIMTSFNLLNPRSEITTNNIYGEE